MGSCKQKNKELQESTKIIEKKYTYLYFHGANLMAQCPVCEKTANRNHFHDKNDDLLFVCPNCGNDISGYKSQNIYYNKNGILSFTGYNIIKKEKEGILTVVLFFTSRILLANKDLIIKKRYNTILSFNINTGQTWLMELRNSDGTKKRPSFWLGPKIMNITFASGSHSLFLNYHQNAISIKAFDDRRLYYDTLQALAEMTNTPYEDMPVYKINRKYSVRDSHSLFRLITFNYIKGYSDSFYETMNIFFDSMIPEKKATRKKKDAEYIIEHTEYHLRSSYVRHMEKQLSDIRVSSYFKKYIKQLRKLNLEEMYEYASNTFALPDKKQIKKLFFKDPTVCIKWALLLRVGFCDYNVILSILKDNEKSINDMLYEMTIRSGYEQSLLSLDFLHTCIQKKGEANVKKLLYSEKFDPQTLRDTANMYKRLTDAGTILNDSFFCGNMTEIHDRISEKYTKLLYPNHAIHYTKDNKTLVSEIDGIRFSLAEDTHYLIDVGKEMGICVGSYGEQALSGSCIIVTMKENNKHVGCIELVNNQKKSQPYKIIQAKAKYNDRLKGYHMEALKKWIAKNNIDVTRCYDINGLNDKDDEEKYEDDWLDFVAF